jgi:hypothetical protein
LTIGKPLLLAASVVLMLLSATGRDTLAAWFDYQYRDSTVRGPGGWNVTVAGTTDQQ